MAPKALRVTLGLGWFFLLSFVIVVAILGGIPSAPRVFQIAYLVGFVGYVLLLRAVRCAANEASLGAWRWWLVGAIVCRLLLLPSQPSDDVYRYVWEGRVQQAGYSPYRLAPDDPRLASIRTDDWEKINHPSFPAIYPPLAQWEFRAVAAIHPSVVVAKLVHVAWDVLTLALLAIVLQRRGFRPHLASVYGLCPLVFTAYAVEGHNDSLMLLLTIAGVAALAWKRPLLAGAALGSAVAAKTIMIVLFPWLLVRYRRAAVMALVALLWWYLSFGMDGLAGLENLRRFGETSEFFSFLSSLGLLNLDEAFGRVASVVLLGSVVVIFAFRCRHIESFSAMAVAALVLALPVVHYWYVSWVLLFVPFTFRWTWPVTAGAMVLYFQAVVLAATSDHWIMPEWVSEVVWLIFILAWMASWFHRPALPEVAVESEVP